MLTLRDIGAEAVLLLGGGRAILLQVANPAVGAGVAEHSNFAERPLDRLKATMTYVYAVVYGTPAQRTEVARRVNRAHVPVRDDGSPATTYNAFDPKLQLWVAATLYDTAVQVYENVFGPLDAESAEQIYRDYSAIGTALQVPEELWPADRHAFRQYWNDAVPQLGTNDATKRVARDLFNPRVAPLWLRTVLPFAQFTTTGLLSPELRNAYDLRWSPRSQRRFDRTMRVIATVYPRLPKRLRFRLKNHYLAQLGV